MHFLLSRGSRRARDGTTSAAPSRNMGSHIAATTSPYSSPTPYRKSDVVHRGNFATIRLDRCARIDAIKRHSGEEKALEGIRHAETDRGVSPAIGRGVRADSGGEGVHLAAHLHRGRCDAVLRYHRRPQPISPG